MCLENKVRVFIYLHIQDYWLHIWSPENMKAVVLRYTLLVLFEVFSSLYTFLFTTLLFLFPLLSLLSFLPLYLFSFFHFTLQIIFCISHVYHTFCHTLYLVFSTFNLEYKIFPLFVIPVESSNVLLTTQGFETILLYFSPDCRVPWLYFYYRFRLQIR